MPLSSMKSLAASFWCSESPKTSGCALHDGLAGMCYVR